MGRSAIYGTGEKKKKSVWALIGLMSSQALYTYRGNTDFFCLTFLTIDASAIYIYI